MSVATTDRPRLAPGHIFGPAGDDDRPPQDPLPTDDGPRFEPMLAAENPTGFEPVLARLSPVLRTVTARIVLRGDDHVDHLARHWTYAVLTERFTTVRDAVGWIRRTYRIYKAAAHRRAAESSANIRRVNFEARRYSAVVAADVVAFGGQTVAVLTRAGRRGWVRDNSADQMAGQLAEARKALAALRPSDCTNFHGFRHAVATRRLRINWLESVASRTPRLMLAAGAGPQRGERPHPEFAEMVERMKNPEP